MKQGIEWEKLNEINTNLASLTLTVGEERHLSEFQIETVNNILTLLKNHTLALSEIAGIARERFKEEWKTNKKG